MTIAKSGKDARFRAPSPHRQPITPSPSSPQPPWRNHPQSPAGNSAGRCAVSCQAKSKPRAMGTLAAVPSVCWPSSNGTIVANPRHRRGAGVASSRCVGWRSSGPSPCLLRRDTALRRPRIRSCRRRSRTPRLGSVAAREGSGSYECHGLRGARPLPPGYSSGSATSRCRPSIPEACYLGKANNPHASILEMLEPFTHTFCCRAMF